MAKPRIFISSTYYDLRHIRNNLETFIKGFGYDPILFESGDIPFEFDKPLDESCYKEIINAHMQVLIIGGRYGAEESKRSHSADKKKKDKTEDEMYRRYNSITKLEYETALSQKIPVFVFVEKGVLSEYDTYKHNKDNNSIRYAHVNSINVFRLIDEIYAQGVGNYIKGFEKFDDISNWLRDQWAGLFAEFLKNNKERVEIRTLSDKIDELNTVSNALKEYTEALLKQTLPEETSKKIIKQEETKITFEKLRRFSNEPLISYIRECPAVDLPIDDLYMMFKKSNSLEDFINQLKVGELLNPLVKKPQALKEFSDIKSIYQSVVI